MSVIWFNGRLTAAGEARIGVLDRGVIWGYGLFETLRAYGGRVWAFEEHDARLRQGARVLEIPLPASDDIRDAMAQVLEANDLSDAGVRVTVTRGEGPADPHDEPTGPPSVFVTAWPLRDYEELYERGAALVTLPGGGRTLAGIKTTSYAVSVAGRLAARRSGADDALFVDGDRVLEGTGSNLMAVRNGRLMTPPVEEGLLPGVTRQRVLDVAGECGLAPDLCPVRLQDLWTAEEVVLTSTLREVYPVRSVDGRELGRNGWAERLREAYLEAVRRGLS